jgi:hypothetical protein
VQPAEHRPAAGAGSRHRIALQFGLRDASVAENLPASSLTALIAPRYDKALRVVPVDQPDRLRAVKASGKIIGGVESWLSALRHRRCRLESADRRIAEGIIPGGDGGARRRTTNRRHAW